MTGAQSPCRLNHPAEKLRSLHCNVSTTMPELLRWEIIWTPLCHASAPTGSSGPPFESSNPTKAGIVQHNTDVYVSSFGCSWVRLSCSPPDSQWPRGRVLTAHPYGHNQFEQLGCSLPLLGNSMKLLWGQTCSSVFRRTNKTKETSPQPAINHILWDQEFSVNKLSYKNKLYRRLLSICAVLL